MGTNQRQRLARQAQRQGQTLRDNLVTSALHQRYMTAASRVLLFWEEARCAPTSWDDFDVATSTWLEHIFTDGLPKGYGSDALAALQHFLPETSGKLRNSLESPGTSFARFAGRPPGCGSYGRGVGEGQLAPARSSASGRV